MLGLISCQWGQCGTKDLTLALSAAAGATVLPGPWGKCATCCVQAVVPMLGLISCYWGDCGTNVLTPLELGLMAPPGASVGPKALVSTGVTGVGVNQLALGPVCYHGFDHF